MATLDATTRHLSGLQTESRNAKSSDIDVVSTIEMCSESPIARTKVDVLTGEPSRDYE